MHFQVVALSFALLSPVINAYPITGDTVNCRSGPGTSYSVVKSYKKGADVSITCQASGTDIKGDSIWDKTADGCYVADYYVKTGSSSYVTKKCDGSSGGGGGGSSGNLPGLSSTQSKHAKAIIGEAKKEDLGRQGCLAGIATALVEVRTIWLLLQFLESILTHSSRTSSSMPTRMSLLHSTIPMMPWVRTMIVWASSSNAPSTIQTSPPTWMPQSQPPSSLRV
jgi:hypothetical protein